MESRLRSIEDEIFRNSQLEAEKALNELQQEKEEWENRVGEIEQQLSVREKSIDNRVISYEQLQGENDFLKQDLTLQRSFR